jgi:hypothetical protein
MPIHHRICHDKEIMASVQLLSQRRSDKLCLFSPLAQTVQESDSSRLSISHKGAEVEVEAPSLYLKQDLFVDTAVGKEQVSTVIGNLRVADSAQVNLIANNAANIASLDQTVAQNKTDIEAALVLETTQRTDSDNVLGETVARNKHDIEAALATETQQRIDADTAATNARIAMQGLLQQEQQAATDATNADVQALRDDFTNETNATLQHRGQLAAEIAQVQSNLNTVVGGALDPQKLEDIKELVTYVNASDGQAALLIMHLCDYVRELKKTVGSLAMSNGVANVPIMDKALEAEANRNLSEAQLADLLTLIGQDVYLYSASIAGSENADWSTKDYTFLGLNSFTPVSGAGGKLAGVYAVYQANTQMLDCDKQPLLRIKPPLRLQTNNYTFENLTIDTSDFADSAAGAAFKRVLQLHGQGLVDNLTVKSCNFKGTVDMDAALFKEWSFIDGRSASVTGNVLICDCCFENSGGHSALQIRGPEAGQGKLASVIIRRCHFRNTSGCICVRAMPLTTAQHAVDNVIIEDVTYEHAPHQKSDPLSWGIIELNGVTTANIKNITVRDAEGSLFATSNADAAYNVVQIWSKARVDADPTQAFIPVSWTFDNIKVESSSFSSAINIPVPTVEYLCPIQGQVVPGVQYLNLVADAFTGCDAAVSHLFPAKGSGVYRALTPQGIETDLPPSYKTDYAALLPSNFGATRRNMYEAQDYD